MSTLIVVLAAISLLIIGVIVFFKFCYTTIPHNMALIVNRQKVYFANAITLPSDKKTFIPLEPIQVKTIYTGEQGVLCKEKLLLDISINYQVCVGPNEAAILEAASKVGIEGVGDKEKVNTALYVVMSRVLRDIVIDLSYDVVDKDRGKLRKQLMSSLQNQLHGYHIDYLDIEKIELTPLDSLAVQNKALFEQQEQVRQEWNKYQREQLEHRLKLVIDRQLDLSNKIKALIADYQRVIRQKINVFINRVG